MYTKKLIIVIVLLGLGRVISTSAAEKDSANVYTLQEVLQLAEKNNTEILKNLADINIAKADKQQALGAFLPSVELSSTYSSTNDPLYAFGFKLQQESVTAADFNPTILNNPETSNHFVTQLKVEQPLVNLDAWMEKSAAKFAYKANVLKAEYTMDHIIFIVKQTYYGLQLAQEKLQVISKAYKAATSYLSMAEDNLKQGYLKETDVLSVKVRLLELQAQQLEAQNQIHSVSEMLNFLIGNPINQPISVTDHIEKVDFNNTGLTSVASRPDVLAMQNGLEAQRLMQKSALMKFVPRVNGFGMYNMYDKDIAQFDANSWLVGINLQWKLFNGGQNLGKYNKARAQFHKSETAYTEYLDKGNMEIMQAQRNINVSESQLLSYQLAAEQSGESLRIRTNRFKEGLERTSDLLSAEAKFAESELKYLNAIYQYNMAVFRYELLSVK